MAMGTERRVESHVAVPALQSLISGLAASLLFGLGSLCLRRWGVVGGSWLDSLLVGAGMFALGFCGVWVMLMWTTWPRRIVPPAPAPMAQTRERIVPVIARGIDVAALERNERQKRFVAFVKACERSTASRELLQQFSENELIEFRDVLMRFGYARWNGSEPRQGWRLTIPASDIVRELHI